MSLTLSIEVTSANGSSQLFTVEGAEARIGSAAYCEIRLPLGEAASEHVALTYRGDTLLATALSLAPPAFIDGEPFTERTLPPESVLSVGDTRLRVSALTSGKGQRKQNANQKSSPWLYIAAPALIAYAISELPHSSTPEETAPKRPPDLFSQPAPCPHAEPNSARAFAGERLHLADSKRERRPFHAADGVRAVELYGLSAACFDVAGEPVTAGHARAAEGRLRTDLEESYRAHRVRLEHALSIRDYVVAGREVRALIDLTSAASGEYVSWLRSLDRRLKLRVETKT